MLEIIGAGVVTGVALYITLMLYAFLVFSDEGIKNTIMWNLRDFIPVFLLFIGIWVLWWFLVGAHLTIGIS